jgi:hypothetical protein
VLPTASLIPTVGGLRHRDPPPHRHRHRRATGRHGALLRPAIAVCRGLTGAPSVAARPARGVRHADSGRAQGALCNPGDGRRGRDSAGRAGALGDGLIGWRIPTSETWPDAAPSRSKTATTSTSTAQSSLNAQVRRTDEPTSRDWLALCMIRGDFALTCGNCEYSWLADVMHDSIQP